jgi:hypothetical protein
MKNLTNTIVLIGLIAVTTTGCSMFGSKADSVDVPRSEAITRQKFSTFFEDDGIKINWECIDRDWFPSLGFSCEESVIESVEATITIPSNGGTDFNAYVASQVGQVEVMGMLVRFINTEITSERVVTLMAQNVEKADDTYRNPITGTGQNAGSRPDIPAVIGMSSREAPRDPNPNMNFALRSNVNSTVRDLNTEVRGTAKGRLIGVAFNYDQRDDQLLQITGLWDRKRAEQLQLLGTQYFNQQP